MYVINIVSEARNRLQNPSKENGLTTGKVRAISSALYKTLQDKSIDNVFTLCERLLDEREWALGVIAYDWAYRARKKYNDKTFSIFEIWLEKYVTGWGDCDFNKSAIACYEKAGLKIEGTFRDVRKINDEYWSLINMSILENEYKKVK